MPVREANRADVQKFLPILTGLLKGRKLPMENGPARECSPEEFGPMHTNSIGTEMGWKHYDSRNYIYVRLRFDRDQGKDVWVLDVPMTDQPFHLGFFDKLG